MTTKQPDNSLPETSLRHDLTQLARYHLRGWRGCAAAAAVLAVPALWLGGPWLVAVGAVPLLISLAPCLAMCAIGLCAMRNCNKLAAAGREGAEASWDVHPAPAATSRIEVGDVEARDARRGDLQRSRDGQ